MALTQRTTIDPPKVFVVTNRPMSIMGTQGLPREELQGFLLSPAVPAKVFVRFLDRDKEE